MNAKEICGNPDMVIPTIELTPTDTPEIKKLERQINTAIERRNESNEEFNREDLYQYRETGWEPEREMFIRAVFREESVKTTYEPNDIGITITIGDIAVARVGIATGLMLSDRYSNNPERRKKEIEEMQQAESAGVVLGVAIGLGYKLYQKYKADDTTDDEDNGEENVPVMMGM